MRFAHDARDSHRRPGSSTACLDWIEGNARRKTPETGHAPETDRDRRDFVLGMMDDHPHAFTSEADVQCMMHLYPGSF
jgi:hypothetical protein